MIIRLVLLVALALAGVAQAEPRIKNVTLEKFTRLTVDVVPDMGTRFVFPFVLDEQDDYVPFTLNITNGVFASDRKAGRNSFVVTIDPKAIGEGRTAVYYGNMFVTVAGYEISIELRTTTKLDQHYSDVVFELGSAERENLIQKGVKQRTQSLEADYKRKLDELDKLADQKAIARVGVLALQKPAVRRIKEETKKALSNGDSVTLYVDQSQTYGPYTVVVFELDNDSNTQGLTVMDAKLFALNTETKAERAIDAAKDIPPRLLPNGHARGAITTLDAALNPKEVLKLQVLTDKLTLEAQW